MEGDLYIGLMSGTSLDGIDVVLVEIDNSSRKINLVRSNFVPFNADFIQRVKSLSLGKYESSDPINELGMIHRELGHRFAKAINEMLNKSPALDRSKIVAVGNHGLTVRHCPNLGNSAFTLQIGDSNTIAAETGINVVGDFRSMDVALGGQGAPLIPAYHEMAYGSAHESRCVLNIGGIANVSILIPGQDLVGFDTGPGNVLLDAWIFKHKGRPFDEDGCWAKEGRLDEDLLEKLLTAEDYFRKESLLLKQELTLKCRHSCRDI